jgi:hypothetical protein
VNIPEFITDWRKSNRSSAQGDNCVEISVIEKGMS